MCISKDCSLVNVSMQYWTELKKHYLESLQSGLALLDAGSGKGDPLLLFGALHLLEHVVTLVCLFVMFLTMVYATCSFAILMYALIECFGVLHPPIISALQPPHAEFYALTI